LTPELVEFLYYKSYFPDEFSFVPRQLDHSKVLHGDDGDDGAELQVPLRIPVAHEPEGGSRSSSSLMSLKAYFSQLHQQFTFSFLTDILAPKSYKAKL